MVWPVTLFLNKAATEKQTKKHNDWISLNKTSVNPLSFFLFCAHSSKSQENKQKTYTAAQHRWTGLTQLHLLELLSNVKWANPTHRYIWCYAFLFDDDVAPKMTFFFLHKSSDGLAT